MQPPRYSFEERPPNQTISQKLLQKIEKIA